MESYGYPCPTVDSAQLAYYDFTPPSGEPEDIYVKVYLNIVRKSDGSSGYPPERLQNIKDILDGAYNPHGIYFVYECEDLFVDDDSLFLYGSSVWFADHYCQWFNYSHHGDGIDIYLINRHVSEGGNSSHLGVAEGIPGKWFVVGQIDLTWEQYRIESTHLVHHMGHLFGLFHTGHGAQLNPHYYDNYPDPPPYSERWDCNTKQKIIADPHECPEHETNGHLCGDYIEDTPRSNFVLEKCRTTIICPTAPGPQDYGYYNITHNTCGTSPGVPWLDIEDVDYDDIPFYNFMSISSQNCLTYFTPGQVDVMRNFLWNHPVLADVVMSEQEVAEFCQCFDPEGVVYNSNTTISGDQIMDGDVFIKTGARLTVTGTMRMLPGTHIYIDRGAVLEVDGGLITKACEDMWNGIRVQGNTNKVQPDHPYTSLATDDAGVVLMRNEGTIEWAILAIHTADPRIPWPGYANYYGAVIDIDNSTLRNNQRGISYMAYDFPNKSYFDRMQLYVEPSAGIINPRGVSIWRCRDLEFTRCIFRNLKYGIEGIDFEARIYNANFFENCHRAIAADGTHPQGANVQVGTYNNQVSKNYFLDNMISVQGNAVNRGVGLIVANNEVSKSQSYRYSDLTNRAVVVTGTSLFDLWSNSFAEQNTGIFISNTGQWSNLARCNGFNITSSSSLRRVGIDAFNYNERFQFKYNTFELDNDCSPDVRIVGLSQPGHVRHDMGIQGDPARNCFSFSGNEQILTVGTTEVFQYWEPEVGDTCYFTTNNLSDMGVNNYFVEKTQIALDIPCSESPGIPDNIAERHDQLLSELQENGWSPGTVGDTSGVVLQLIAEFHRVRGLLIDSLWKDQNTTELVNLFTTELSGTDHRNLYGVYVNASDYLNAENTLNAMPLATEEDSVFKSVQIINLKYLQDTLGMGPDSTELMELEELAAKEVPSAYYAQSLLVRFTHERVDLWDLIFCPSTGNREVPEESVRDRDKLIFEIAPVPASNYITISWNQPDLVMKSLEVATLSGEVRNSIAGHANPGVQISLSSLNPGLYILRIEMEDGSIHTQKIIKQ